jgi:hypothetical protein
MKVQRHRTGGDDVDGAYNNRPARAPKRQQDDGGHLGRFPGSGPAEKMAEDAESPNKPRVNHVWNAVWGSPVPRRVPL